MDILEKINYIPIIQKIVFLLHNYIEYGFLTMNETEEWKYEEWLEYT